jgi:hypothetical protein
MILLIVAIVVLCRIPVARSLVFCVMSLFALFGLISSVIASSTPYQVDHNRNHKLKNMQSTTRCILHMQVLLENHNPDIYSFMILLIVAIVTRPVSQIEQEVLTLVEHYNSPVVL